MVVGARQSFQFRQIAWFLGDRALNFYMGFALLN